jgi:hypothetical protein
MAEVKTRVRAAFHPQLVQVWKSHPLMTMPGSLYSSRYAEPPVTFVERSALEHQQANISGQVYSFVPLITDRNYHGCSIQVLFLRRDIPGSSPLIKVDPIVKTIFGQQ